VPWLPSSFNRQQALVFLSILYFFFTLLFSKSQQPALQSSAAMYTQQLVLIAAVLSAPLLSSANCMYGTSLFPRVAGATVEVSKFGYTGLQGPLNWAALSAENSACATSKVQSPINIDNTVQLAAEAPKVVIADMKEAEFENLGTTVEVIVNGTTTFGGTKFSLQQFHFHTPSEHRVAEEYFPLEIHMVHEAAGKNSPVPF